MKKLLIILFICMQPCLSRDAIDIAGDFIPLDKFERPVFPEDRNKEINVRNIKSPLEFKNKNSEDKYAELRKIFNKNLDQVKEMASDLGVINKIVLGQGIIDVTFQVKDGVKYALKETLSGYPEYQRRKTTEEIINANLESHHNIDKFLINKVRDNDFGQESIANIFVTSIGDIFFGDLLDSFKSRNSLIQITKRISNKNKIQKLYELFRIFAFALLTILIFLQVFQRLYHHDFNLHYIVSGPLLSFIAAWILMALMPYLMNIAFKLVSFMQFAISDLLDSFLADYNPAASHLERSWFYLVNETGYLPAMILSILDILVQFFTYFFIAGLILYLVIGKIISPFWALALASPSLKSHSLNSLINWLKVLMVMALIPISYLIIHYISKEFSNQDYAFLDISLSIASFLYLPALANIVLAKGSGIFQPAFNGYQIVVDSINSSYHGLRTAIEESHNKTVYDLENAKIK